MAVPNSTGAIGRVSKRIGRYVNHDDVLVRFVSLWLVVASVFTAAWVLSYLFVPQGLLPADQGDGRRRRLAPARCDRRILSEADS